MIEPIYRIEYFLDAIVNNTAPPTPIYRTEFYLAKIAGANVSIPTPVYRIEFYLAYLCGETVSLPDPVYRMEYYLAKLCGMQVEAPEPIYRVEYWLWDWCGGGGIEKTIIGNPIHITDALAKPVQALSIALEPIQDLNGYDNPWPAGGGKNKFDVSVIVPFNSNVTVTKDGGSFTVVNNNSYVAAMFCDVGGNIMQFPVTDGRYTISIGEAATVVIGVYGSTDGITFSWLSNGIQAGNTSATFTVSGQSYIQFRASAPANGSATIKNFMFESGETATAWTPYSNICPITGHSSVNVIVSPTLNPGDGTITNIPLGQTVYGGTLDVLTGVLTVTHGTVDLGTLNWTYDSAYTRFRSSYIAGMITKPSARMVEILSDMFISIYDGRPVASVPNNAIYTGAGEQFAYIKTDLYTDADVFKSFVNGHIIVYPLATPQTIQLTATQVELLLGENNIWSDGTITMTYLADGNASDEEALNILLGGRYVNNHTEDEPSDSEALNILLGE